MALNDPGSNMTITDVLDAKSRTAATVYTDAISHITGNGNSVSFLVSCGTWATSLAITVQYSDDNSSWTDQTDDGSGNDYSASLTEAGNTQLNVPNPRGKYSRLKLVLGGTCVVSVAAIQGPKLLNTPDATAYAS